MMATLGFLDPPKTSDQTERERRPEDVLRAARVERVVWVVLWGLGLAGLVVCALIALAIWSMVTSKQHWLSTLRAQYAVESLTPVGGPGLTDTLDCWSGPTVHFVASLKNQKVESPTSTSVAVTLTGGLDSVLDRRTVEQTVMLPGTAMPRVGDTVEVPFSVDVPAWMSNKSVTWTVTATGSGDEPPNRGSMATTVEPCAHGV